MDEPRRIVARDALERVAEGVAEVEKRAVAFLALVAHHHGGLGAAALRHGLVALGPAVEHAAPLRFAPVEEGGVADQAVLHHLGVARAHLAQRQRVEQRRVGEDEARLVERADEVLAVGRVDAGLAADRRIDLGQQAWWESARSGHRAASTAAAKPARSPTTPPPSAITRSPRSMRAARTASQTRSSDA